MLCLCEVGKDLGFSRSKVGSWSHILISGPGLRCMSLIPVVDGDLLINLRLRYFVYSSRFEIFRFLVNFSCTTL